MTIGRKALLMILGILFLAGCPDQDRELPAPPISEKEEKRLETIFREYEATRLAAMKIRYRFKKTEVDTTFNTKKIYSGEVVLNNLNQYRIEVPDDKGQLVELFAWNGKEFYMAQFQNNQTRVFESTPTDDKEKAQALDWIRQSITGHFIGLPIEDAKTLFHIRLEQEDKDWIYLTLFPRTSSLKASYSRMRVVLDRKTKRIRQIWHEQPNGSEVTFDFEIPIEEKVPISKDSLLQDFPKKMVRFPQEIRIPKPD
jgi:hypothetical protein